MSSTFSRCKWDGGINLDPIQKVRLVLSKETQVSAVSIELTEPAESESSVSRFLERGRHAPPLLRGRGSGVAPGVLQVCRHDHQSAPIPAVAFRGRCIAWALTRKRLLVELLEN